MFIHIRCELPLRRTASAILSGRRLEQLPYGALAVATDPSGIHSRYERANTLACTGRLEWQLAAVGGQRVAFPWRIRRSLLVQLQASAPCILAAADHAFS